MLAQERSEEDAAKQSMALASLQAFPRKEELPDLPDLTSDSDSHQFTQKP